jgi:hypothetical protein
VKINQPRRSKTLQPNSSSRRSLTERVMALPRAGRTAIVFLGVLTIAFAMTSVVGELYARAFNATIFDQTVYWIVAVICLGMYMAGYVYIIGIPGAAPAPGRTQSIYLVTIFALAVLSLVWLLVRGAGAMAE